MQEAIHACDEELKRNQVSIENVDSDYANLQAKIEKKKTGLDRGQKRLLTLKKVRCVRIIYRMCTFCLTSLWWEHVAMYFIKKASNLLKSSPN